MTPPDDFDPPIGVAEELEAGVRRIVAPNPSPMTYRGTNTYLVGDLSLAVIDPGPDDDNHLAAIMAAIGPTRRVSHIIVTHTHLDHSPLATPLSVETGAPIYAFGGARDGLSPIMQALAETGMVGGSEGVDSGFCPDHKLVDGDRIEGSDWFLDVLHTPGHIGNHICLGWDDICFTADHVMGWASSLVSPPEGDLTDFMASCSKLKVRDWRVFYPGHGAPIREPHARLDWLISHRLSREEAILSALRHSPAAAADLAQLIYTDTQPGLLPAATRNVFAHLLDLANKDLIQVQSHLHEKAVFQLK